MNNIKYILLFALTIVVFSCKKTIPFDSEYSHPKLVMNSILRAGKTPVVFITKSKSVIENKTSFEEIKDAEVTLYKNAEKIATLSYEPKIKGEKDYKGSKYVLKNYTLKENTSYKVVVKEASMGEVSAETKILSKVEISDIQIKTEKIFKEGYENNYVIAEITFKDPVGDDFFQVKCLELFWGVPKFDIKVVNGKIVKTSTDTITTYRDYPNVGQFSMYDQIDPIMKSKKGELSIENFNHFDIFNDDLIKDKTYTLKFVIDKYSTLEAFKNIDKGSFLQAKIQLNHIHSSLYSYYKTLAAYYDNKENFFTEPILIYSNVKNGLGIFSAETANTKTTTLGTYPMGGKVYEPYNKNK